jgi:hypothetical protein
VIFDHPHNAADRAKMWRRTGALRGASVQSSQNPQPWRKRPGRQRQFSMPAGRTAVMAASEGAACVRVLYDDWEVVLAPVARGVVLLHHAGWDAPALIDRDAAVFRPGPDITAALTAGRGTPWPARWRPPGLAGVLEERGELLAKRGGVLLVQVDLIVCAAEGEAHRLLCRAAIQVIFDATVTFWTISASPAAMVPAPYPGQCPAPSRNAALLARER